MGNLKTRKIENKRNREAREGDGKCKQTAKRQESKGGKF